MFVAVVAAIAPLSSNNGGWRTIFYVVGRIALILLAISIGEESFSVSGFKGSQHGAVIFALLIDIVMTVIIIALLFVGLPAGSGGDSFTDNIRSLLTPIRNTVAQLAMIFILVVGGIVGFSLHCAVIAKHNKAGTKGARVFAAMFAIVGYILSILIGGLSAFLFLSNSQSDLIDLAHSTASSIAVFLVSYVAGFYGAASPFSADIVVAALVFDALLIMALYFQSVLNHLSGFAGQSYEPIKDTPAPIAPPHP